MLDSCSGSNDIPKQTSAFSSYYISLQVFRVKHTALMCYTRNTKERK